MPDVTSLWLLLHHGCVYIVKGTWLSLTLSDSAVQHWSTTLSKICIQVKQSMNLSAPFSLVPQNRLLFRCVLPLSGELMICIHFECSSYIKITLLIYLSCFSHLNIISAFYSNEWEREVVILLIVAATSLL